MASITKVILIGNLGRDPEVRYTPSGAAVCNVSVATTRNWKDKSSGDKVEETEWHRVVFYDRLAEIAGEYLKKGRPVYVEGRLKTRKWQDKDGKDNYTTEIVAEQMQLLGGRDGGGAGDDAGGGVCSGDDHRRNTPAPGGNRPVVAHTPAAAVRSTQAAVRRKPVAVAHTPAAAHRPHAAGWQPRSPRRLRRLKHPIRPGHPNHHHGRRLGLP